MKINDEIKKHHRREKIMTVFVQIVFILVLCLIVFSLLSCSKDDDTKPCNTECGKLISKYHYRDIQTVQYTYVTNCNDTLTSTVFLNEEQLGVDNGVAYFINTYSLKDYYCEP